MAIKHKVSNASLQRNGNENPNEIPLHTYLRGCEVQNTMSNVDKDREQLTVVYITCDNANGGTTLTNYLEVS